ncbi:fumarylacetoacetate hydrolase family protein [Candidatus Bathyarchaeota archaeon]|nr:fumarylacetoacetate hydrolase family protein [Candidatus Bathyarchaeota archaeon]
MKLVRYAYKDGVSYGIMFEDHVVCLPKLAKCMGKRLPSTIEGFIEKGEELAKKAEKFLESAPTDTLNSCSIQLEAVSLLAPISKPPKIICLGLNYMDHIEESITEHGTKVPDDLIIFLKPHTTIIGPNENIIKPKFVKKLDYEAELAIVIGKRGKNIPVSEAKACIFGYTIMNDVSARDIQFKDIQWTRGKSFDTFAPIGPCIVTRSQIKDVSNLRIRTWVNGELRQNSNTGKMVFNVYEIVHRLSRVMTLEPGDIIATGTPAGVGIALKPKPKFLKDGDVVRIEIEEIGVLENRVVEADF